MPREAELLTLRIDKALYQRAKAAAAEQGVTLTRFIEQSLREKLEGKARTQATRLSP
ncbi:MAG: YlcI/YnfO family protein [Deinococcus sp.]|uniref:YlcI/YnfO family protein n=1 Tax=Deinococcus sp. TaxID=47478 RepID=UPI0026DD10A8|nr:YlcI/YnfO family protein [Deinococcus sp.]MDO4245215.1 YlcI/YnfO family protein [Deinococcus sp.]